MQKINQNIRLTYLRDTAFSRLIDDNTNRIINTIIQMNHTDIIQFFINNKEYINTLFSQLQSEDILILKDSVLFLSELISCSKNVSQSRVSFNELLCSNGILSILSKLIEDSPQNITKNKKNEVKELININAVEILISILNAVPFLMRQYIIDNEGQLLQKLTNLILYHENFGVKSEVSQIFKTIIEDNGEPYDKKKFFNYTIDTFISFLISPFDYQNKNDISSTIQIIIEIFMAWINNMGFDHQFWLEQNQIDLAIIKLFEEKNKIINLYAIKFLKIIVENCEHNISIKILNNKLCKLLIDLLSQNLKKNNIISSCLLNFLDSISQNDIYLLNIIMNYSSDFFYNNKEYFKSIILRYERKATPKRKLISYLNINTITDTSLKDVEPILNQNIESSKEKEIEDYIDLFDDDKLIHETNEYEFNLLNDNFDVFSNEKINDDDRIDYLCKKRNGDKYSDDDNGNKIDDLDINVIEPLNQKINNYGKNCYNNCNFLLKEKNKQKNHNGISLKETEEDYDDDLYDNYEQEF